MFMQTKVRMFGSESWKDTYITALTTAGKTLHVVVLLFASMQNLSISFWMGRVERMMVILILAFSFLSTSQYICIALFPNSHCPSISSLKQSLLCCFAFKLPKNCSRSSTTEKWSKSICQVCKLLDGNCSYFLEVAELLMHHCVN